MALLQACQSPILLKFCAQLYDLNVRYRYLAGRSKIYSKRDVAKEHVAILAAAIDRDVDKTITHLQKHYKKTGAFLRDQLT